MSKVWFVTGAARGFGKLWVTAALKRGDKVAATARDIASLDSLVGEFGGAILPIELDVTDRSAVFAAVARAKDAFGRLDVVISNAGYGHQGAIEEASEDEARAQMETNLFGALWVAQAALPILRAQQSGHIIAVSSTLGLVAIPNFGIYQASKFAVEGLFDTLSQEVSRFGVNVTLIEPSAYATDFTSPSSARHSAATATYAAQRAELAEHHKSLDFGDPTATTGAILKLIDSANPPLRLLLGAGAHPHVLQVYERRVAQWQAWRDTSIAAHG
ncbi:SDR family NAD(P)-dependent oxidoreductase [Pseudomonas gingeri]|uniref:SDR family NAD(P)-dependent oxidoreductase n=1 Tax=Pseudomonas gingeri TaxID=117681 RepID=A0A7Y7XHP5_9PSED|nr:SDR family NAD(P)-dependent oxidoreductase [Pseudomonas gingeri]NWA27988.1 SDR family NAD(P)-dependent oxidoreductase [Pseudomonas gingeri]NWC00013.1 SDR family NAD(P)-dependent oxidoreductase [Pseudomonas gingeri]NWD70061.1 SDR family NAD(P)-dependent oxidoreductase [Pseudomonas gingeri]NWD74023.1 SDR family NAD(P)-dependent oxidoreductase [Pseudomonas gingeri]